MSKEEQVLENLSEKSNKVLKEFISKVGIAIVSVDEKGFEVDDPKLGIKKIGYRDEDINDFIEKSFNALCSRD